MISDVDGGERESSSLRKIVLRHVNTSVLRGINLLLGKCGGELSGRKLYVWFKASVQYLNVVQISEMNKSITHIFVFNQKFFEYEFHDVSDF